MEFWIAIFLALLPMYFANSSAVVFGGKTPLDLNLNWWDGRRIFGKGKTFKGTLGGIFIGTSVAVILSNIAPGVTSAFVNNYVLFGFVVSIGALLGDLVESFFKRRFGMQSGEPLLLLDQLDFLIGGILAGWIWFAPSIPQIAVMLVLTLLLHRLFNWIAFKTQLKEVPW